MYIEINESHYWVEESGDGAPVLLLHGFTGSVGTWSDLFPVLAPDFRVIRIDLPGHGETVVADQLDMASFCRDLADLLDYLNIERIHIAGYSLGGRTALSFASYYPHRTASLILESASPGLSTEQERKKRQQADERLAQRIESFGVSPFVDYWETLPLFATQQKLSKEKQQQIRQERLSQQSEGLVNSLKGMGTGTQPSWWNSLSEFSLPVLLLVGDDDEKFLEINKRMNERLLHSELKIISGAGHAIHVEQPEIFGTIVHGFLLNVLNNEVEG